MLLIYFGFLVNLHVYTCVLSTELNWMEIVSHIYSVMLVYRSLSISTSAYLYQVQFMLCNHTSWPPIHSTLYTINSCQFM